MQSSTKTAPDMFGTVDGTAYAQLLHLAHESSEVLPHVQQVVHNECTNLAFSLFSGPGTIVLVVRVVAKPGTKEMEMKKQK